MKNIFQRTTLFFKHSQNKTKLVIIFCKNEVHNYFICIFLFLIYRNFGCSGRCKDGSGVPSDPFRRKRSVEPIEGFEDVS